MLLRLPYNLPGFSHRNSQAKQAQGIQSSPRSSTFPSLLRTLPRGPRSQKQPPTSKHRPPTKMENSGERPYSRRDSVQAPPAYDAKAAPASGTHTFHEVPVDNPNLLSPSSTFTIGKSQTRKRSPSRVAIDAIKGIFAGSSDKESTNSSRNTGHTMDVSIIGQMTLNIAASPGAMSTLQVPSPVVTPRSEAPIPAYSSRNLSQQGTPPSKVQTSDGYFPTQSQKRIITPATEDQLNDLKNFDTQFLIDDSGSMKQSTSTIAKGKTHWEEVKLVLSDIVKVCADYDENGVDVFFFNSSLVGQFNKTNIKDPKEVMELFEARSQAGIRGSTPTAEALDLIISPYLKECERRVDDQPFPKPKNVIVMTDGAANNNKLLKQNLIRYAKRLDAIKAPSSQIGVQFFQVGNVEGVDDFLIHLDNALAEENDCRDFIDTRSSDAMGPEGLTAKGVLTTVLGGVIRSNSPVTSSTTEYDVASKNEPQDHRKKKSKTRDDEKAKKSREEKPGDNNRKTREGKSKERDSRKSRERGPRDSGEKIREGKSRGKEGGSREGKRERSKSGSEREHEKPKYR